ncbi:hypothetical protein ZWY2020_053495 [Hordeum vulgare]|nr:hypothetical protein ZWY2020_053495 [Hordeum vulgare]
MFAFDEGYFDASLHTLDFLAALDRALHRARDSHLALQVQDPAIRHARVLDVLQRFKADLFTDEFFATFQAAYRQQLAVLDRLRRFKGASSMDNFKYVYCHWNERFGVSYIKAICKLYRHINEDQCAAITEMGTGLFLDIKCGYLHNTLVTWFTRLYHPGRRGFVVHRRGFIPLTEESVHQILGIPRGDIDVKYEADYDNEDEILRYLDALDCDGMELDLPDTPHIVNAWSKTQVDVVAEMDMLEHDPPSFGNFQGLTAPTTSNSSNSRINSDTDTREREDTLSEDSSSSESDDGTDEDDVDIEREKKKRNTREEHIDSGNDESPLMRNETESCEKTLSGDPSAQFDTKSPSGATSQLNLPSDSDVCSSENNSPTDTLVNSQELEQKIRGSAARLANRLCELKSTRSADTERDSGSTHEEIKLIVEKELRLLKETCTEHFEERNAHKDLTKINARPIKQMPRR